MGSLFGHISWGITTIVSIGLILVTIVTVLNGASVQAEINQGNRNNNDSDKEFPIVAGQEEDKSSLPSSSSKGKHLLGYRFLVQDAQNIRPNAESTASSSSSTSAEAVNATSTPCQQRQSNRSTVQLVATQDCLPTCKTDKDCGNGKEKCKCDGYCGLSCIDPDMCKYLPPAPTNGMVIGSKDDNGMQATFLCDDGYSLIDGPNITRCVNGGWVPKEQMPSCILSKKLFLRQKRKAIKTGGSSVLRSKYGGGGGAGGGRRSFRRRKMGAETAGMDDDDDLSNWDCEDLDPLIDVEILESGKYDTNDTFSDGAVLNVSCGHGHYVNLPNQIAKCVKGEWKPKLPQCKAMPCKVPYIEHAVCYEGSKMLYFEELVRYGKSINIHCLNGFKLLGVSKMVCQFGEWEIASYPPECQPAPCTLPELKHGNYLGSAVLGDLIQHDEDVDYHCGGDYRKFREGSVHCQFGEWKPEVPYCVHPSIDMSYASQSNIIKINVTKRACNQPAAERGAILYVNGRPLDPNDYNKRYPDTTDVLYKCMGHPGNKTLKRNRWLRTCNDGVWSGSPLPCDGEIDPIVIQTLLETINSSCFYGDRENNLVLFLNHRKQVDNKTDEFPTGSVITTRCSDIGKFEFRGAIHRKCVSGQWLGTTPKCEGLSQIHDYALDKNPTILFRYVNGSIGQSNSGELIVYPGTTVHMECLWIRKFGPPTWEVKRNSTVLKEYVQGWAEDIPDRNRDLEYRITIPNADEHDTGIYTCKTPSRHSHSVRIIVEVITCPELPSRNSLIYSSRDRHLGAEVNMSCDGTFYSLIGEKNVTCLANGQWSAPLPKCEKLRVKCPEPPELENGFVSGSPPFKPGDLAHFECKPGYMMEGGQAMAVCQDNGKWSRVPGLECVQACTYPGTIVSGTITPVKFYYRVQETIIFDCVQGFELRGAAMVHCLDGGHWSNSLPSCIRLHNNK